MKDVVFQIKIAHVYDKSGSGLSIGSVIDDKTIKKRLVDEYKKDRTTPKMANRIPIIVGLPGSTNDILEAGKANSLNRRIGRAQQKTYDLLMIKGKQIILKQLDG